MREGAGRPLAVGLTRRGNRVKGLVFTGFLDMVEDRFSVVVAETIVARADLPSGGAYTAVGTYDHGEIVALVVELAKETELDVPDLLEAFGDYLLASFSESYPAFFQDFESAFDFLPTVQRHIHVEVRKLYPDAELPSLIAEQTDPGRMILTYESERGFARVAEGLIRGCIRYFGDDIDLTVEDLSEGAGTKVRFSLERRD